MEFRNCDGQNQRTPLPPPRPLSAAANVSKCPLRGYEFAPGDFPNNVLKPRVFLSPASINADEAFQRELEKEQIQRELEKEEIRREIIASEMAKARRLELEEEVRKEMASERAFEIPMEKSEGISFRDLMFNNKQAPVQIKMIGGQQFHLPSHSQADHKPWINNDIVITLAKPDADNCGGKRKHKAVIPVVVDSESLQKKAKQEWSCDLCQITATSEKGLNDHIQGKKHKAKEASMRNQKIGLDSRLGNQTLKPGIAPADTGKLKSREEDLAVHKSNYLGGKDNQNETTTSKEVGERNALTKRKKFKFWCAFCQVGTRSKIVMQSHENGKKHLANMKKFSQNNDGSTNPG